MVAAATATPWWEKLSAELRDWLLRGPLGQLVARAVGQPFDPQLAQRSDRLVFEALFLMMGHLAKADGRVSEHEIAVARLVMDRLGLDPLRRRQAMELFTLGKRPGLRFDAILSQVRQVSRQRPLLAVLFVETCVFIATADGSPDRRQQYLLRRIGEGLGVPPVVLTRLEQLAQSLAYHQVAVAPNASGVGLDQAYAVLGVSKLASELEIKRAYRRLMSQHHPDKLQSQNPTPEQLGLAEQRTREIRQAYERIAQDRSWAR